MIHYQSDVFHRYPDGQDSELKQLDLAIHDAIFKVAVVCLAIDQVFGKIDHLL